MAAPETIVAIAFESCHPGNLYGRLHIPRRGLANLDPTEER
jgi:hypothetical protein